MFNKNKKSEEVQSDNQKSKDKPGVVINKDAAMNPRENKNSNQEKSDMQSEGGNARHST